MYIYIYRVFHIYMYVYICIYIYTYICMYINMYVSHDLLKNHGLILHFKEKNRRPKMNTHTYKTDIKLTCNMVNIIQKSQ